MSSQYRVVVANNIEDFLAKKSRFINQCYQLDKGPFLGKTEVLYDSAITFTRRTINCTIVERGRYSNNLRGFTFHSRNGSYFRNGVPFGEDDISVSCTGDDFITLIKSGCTYHSMMVNDRFAKKHLSKKDWKTYQHLNASDNSVVVRDSYENSTIIHKIDDTLNALADGQLIDTENQSIENIQTELLQDLVTMAENASIEKLRSNATHKTIHKACKLILDSRIKSISVEELAERVKTSRRNLEHIFQSSIGISPKQFILSVRMNRVRNDLLNKIDLSATGIAKTYGITHQGHFSSTYKNLFNELPSETRGRAAASLQA